MGGIIFASHNWKCCCLLQISPAAGSCLLPGQSSRPVAANCSQVGAAGEGHMQSETGISGVCFCFPHNWGFLQLKSRVLMTPLAISPPRSTPEPDVSSIPQDAATVPKSTTPQALTGMWTEECCSKGVNRSHSWQPAAVLFRTSTARENGTFPNQTDWQ